MFKQLLFGVYTLVLQASIFVIKTPTCAYEIENLILVCEYPKLELQAPKSHCIQGIAWFAYNFGFKMTQTSASQPRLRVTCFTLALNPVEQIPRTQCTLLGLAKSF